MIVPVLIVILLFVIVGLATLDFIAYLASGKDLVSPGINFLFEVVLLILFPIIFFSISGKYNSCCGDTAPFSPDHALTIYVIIGLSLVAYFLSARRKRVYPPVPEVAVNAFLIIGIVFNLFLMYQIQNEDYWALDVPVLALFLKRLIKNHHEIIQFLVEEHEASSELNDALLNILKYPLWVKLPFFILCAIPALFLVSAVLLLFGQKPDSAIQAFTQTYKHGLSQIDHECAGVVCGDDYLCTIGSRGHQTLIRPVRSGWRGGRSIVCSRQLLICNAFEELMMHYTPRVHQFLRRIYDRLGRWIIKHHNFFRNKWVADLSYLFLKPMEWIFLIILYSHDRHPEGRIARQYIQTNPNPVTT